MLSLILLVVLVLTLVLKFTSKKAWFKRMLFYFVILIVVECFALFEWFGHRNDRMVFDDIQNSNEILEEQMDHLKKEMMGNLSEERLEVVLETYDELKEQKIINEEKIEECRYWFENRYRKLRFVLFFQ